MRQGTARLVASNGTSIGAGRAYLHLRLPDAEPQSAQGTMSLDWWTDDANLQAAALELQDGPTMVLRLESDRLSSCMVGRILRYHVDWPGVGP